MESSEITVNHSPSATSELGLIENKEEYNLILLIHSTPLLRRRPRCSREFILVTYDLLKEERKLLTQAWARLLNNNLHLWRDCPPCVPVPALFSRLACSRVLWNSSCNVCKHRITASYRVRDCHKLVSSYHSSL
jgi:hypothetical protein